MNKSKESSKWKRRPNAFHLAIQQQGSSITKNKKKFQKAKERRDNKVKQYE